MVQNVYSQANDPNEIYKYKNKNGEIELWEMPKKLIASVCLKTEGVSKGLSEQWESTLYMVQTNLKEIAKNGGAKFLSVSINKDGICNYEISISGIYNGTSYSKVVSCGVGKVRQDTDGGFYVSYLGGPVIGYQCQ